MTEKARVLVTGMGGELGTRVAQLIEAREWAGDIIGVDFGCFKDGYCGDSARTIAVGKISGEAKRLIDVTREALELGQDFTTFYESCRVVGATPDTLESFRIALSLAAQRTIALSLWLLGVGAPASM